MSKVIGWVVLLAICLSLLTVISGKTCSKIIIHTYTKMKLNPVTQRLTSEIASQQSFMFVCCQGYHEISRTRGQPNCKLNCPLDCGRGTCQGPSNCVCDDGFTHSENGTCEIAENKAVPSTEDPSHLIVPLERIATTPRKPELYLTPTKSECGSCHQGSCVSGSCVCPSNHKITQEGNCQPICPQSCPNGRCVAGTHCECLDGYTYDAHSLQCKPLCSGKPNDCIRGSCVRCDTDTALYEDRFEWRWFLLLLLIPVAIMISSCYCILRRWKKNKAHRLEAQGESFAEVRFFNPSMDNSLLEKQ